LKIKIKKKEDKNLRNKLSKEATKVKEKYSLDKIVKEWERTMNKVLKEKT